MAAKFIYIEQYQVFYYSASSDQQEAAYINCFDTKMNQVGVIKFLYDNVALRPNSMVPNVGAVIHYHLNRFNDVIGLLENARYGVQSMLISFDAANNIFALCNNLYVPVGRK
jgi:hypothetical protein